MTQPHSNGSSCRGLPSRRVRIKPAVGVSEVLQLPVKGGCYKAGTLVRGDHCLVGEAVGPGFDFRDFEWGTAEGLCAVHPRFDKEGELGALLHPDQRRDFAKFYAGA